MVLRTLFSLEISVQCTPVQPHIHSSEMQMNEAHPGCHMFKLEQLLFVLDLFYFFFWFVCFCICFIYLHFIYFSFSFPGCSYSVGKWIYYNFFLDFSSFSSQSCFLKKSSGFRPCLAYSIASFCQTAILTFLDVCLGEDVFGRTVVIARRLSSEIGRNCKKVSKLLVWEFH